MSASVRRTLFVYESDACLREIDIEPGYHYLGVDEQGRLQASLSIEALADAFARLEMLKDGSASLRARSPDADLYVNERPMREATLREAFAVAIPPQVARRPSVLMGSAAPWNEPAVSASNPTPQAMPTSL